MRFHFWWFLVVQWKNKLWSDVYICNRFITGVQEYMYTLTVCLLCLSFAFRYLAIDPDKKRRTNLLQFSWMYIFRQSFLIFFDYLIPPTLQFANVTIAILIVLNSPMAPMYHYAIARDDDPIITKYRNTSGFESLGNAYFFLKRTTDLFSAVINYEDPFTLWLCVYTVMTSLVPFLACVKLRKMTMEVLKEHEVSSIMKYDRPESKKNQKSMIVLLKQQHAMLVRVSISVIF